jgi:hypothetical protein
VRSLRYRRVKPGEVLEFGELASKLSSISRSDRLPPAMLRTALVACSVAGSEDPDAQHGLSSRVSDGAGSNGVSD